MSEIKERPILFSAPMVRAILEGRKTVTRRPVKVQPFDLSWSRHNHRIEYTAGRAENGDEVDGFHAYSTRSGGEWSAKFPYGQPGDRLWVREAWAADAQLDAIPPRELSQGEPIRYPADGTTRQTGCSMITPGKTRPSIHMPRWTSRILLEITEVRVERLQDITPEQVTAEGVSTRGEAMWGGQWWVDAPQQAIEDARKDFADLWTSTGGDWNANPWVWVVEFKRVTP